MLSIEEIRALGDVDPEFEVILKSGSPFLAGWNSDTNIPQLRSIIAKAKEAQPKPDLASLAYTQEDIEVPVRDDGKVVVRVYKPRGDAPEDGRPGFIVFHGGGYAVGDLDTEAWLCALFAELGGVAVNVDYRHAPEHVFPAAINDAFDATKWVAQNVESLGINPKKGLLIGGESSGGDMALIVAHLYQEEESVPEKYKDYFISMEQLADAPVLDAASIQFIRKNYQADLKSPLVFPLLFPDHGGIPKTYFQVCGLDVVRDCGLVVEQVLRDAGVPTRLDIYPGVPHAFWALFPQLSQSKKQAQDARKGLEWLLTR
ncbi:AB hydrolase superfamily protein B1A11.02 [Cladobotryum mycophilum]|uniref:AB hydrolase superfamily protein B1A11.02 n=1 Tax=Cladobotryum mycophilum TaxID=491253 RepID=A0ABR0SF35_9HYPO